MDKKVIDEKLTAFHDQLQDLIEEYATEELSHGTLIQELMSYSDRYRTRCL